jgi:DNA-binding NarL/FixJ family response regulator
MGLARMSGAPSDSYLGGLFRSCSAGNLARRYARQRQLAKQKPTPKPRKQRAPVVPKPFKRDQVAELLSQGLDFDQIASSIGITTKAVRRHFEAIRQRLGAQAR